MKRGIVITALIAIVLSAVSFAVFKYLSKQRDFEKYKTMPTFSFETLFNSTQNTSDLPKYDGYVVQIFNPGCEVCQTEASDYFDHKESLENICFIMLSSDSIINIKDFALKKQLYNVDNFVFGHIEMSVFENHFGDVLIPSLFIYDSEKKIITKTRVATSAKIIGYFKDKHLKR